MIDGINEDMTVESYHDMIRTEAVPLAIVQAAHYVCVLVWVDNEWQLRGYFSSYMQAHYFAARAPKGKYNMTLIEESEANDMRHMLVRKIEHHKQLFLL